MVAQPQLQQLRMRLQKITKSGDIDPPHTELYQVLIHKPDELSELAAIKKVKDLMTLYNCD